MRKKSRIGTKSPDSSVVSSPSPSFVLIDRRVPCPPFGTDDHDVRTCRMREKSQVRYHRRFRPSPLPRRVRHRPPRFGTVSRALSSIAIGVTLGVGSTLPRSRGPLTTISAGCSPVRPGSSGPGGGRKKEHSGRGGGSMVAENVVTVQAGVLLAPTLRLFEYVQ